MSSESVPKVKIEIKPLTELLQNWRDLKPRNLIAVLQRTQDIYGYLPMPALDHIAQFMRVSQARVFGVATFYSQFRLKPLGVHLIQVCNGTACNVKGSEALLDELVAILGIRPGETTEDGKISLEQVTCIGACGVAPAVVVDGEVHGRMTPKSIRKLADNLLKAPTKKARIPVATLKDAVTDKKSFLSRCCDKCKNREDSPCPEFLLCRLEDKSCHNDEICQQYRQELRRLVNHQGKQTITKIAMCRGLTCDAAFGPAIQSTPTAIIELISEAGLRGRGGGGFPTGKKWAIVRAQKDNERFLICNADEGDPGAFMDRSILEGDPHRVLEGILIGAYAIGAQHAFIYCRAEYPLAIRRLEIAITQARKYGLIGKNILGSGINLEIEIIQGAGAFVCGEETAMIASIEGKRGMAVNKPPYPAQDGFNHHPTCVNNVETFANIPLIVKNGAAWFREVGTEKSPGTKIFSLSGKIRNTGLVEVPIGITAHELIHVIGGGAAEGSSIKAAQTGGPSGGCIPSDHMNVAIDYENLRAIGSMMGSGGFVVTDSGTCMVAFAKFFLSFTQHESCGKCIPCREGTKRMLEILERITDGKGTISDLNKLKHLAAVIHRTSACGLGQSAPNPVLSTIRYFEHEYLSHINDLHCLAGVCKSLVTFRILNNCRGCGLCARYCPEQCISGNKGEIYKIDHSRCTKCAQCQRVCPFGAVART
ncbi:MAG: NAD(P)H-dependent oxidoreductase subunit E [Deltaproteobacteria bacterium]|nr:NAD(P)H-dependent oxidoreductase subunit E [Deltaproteobacteria bacterium]